MKKSLLIVAIAMANLGVVHAQVDSTAQTSPDVQPEKTLIAENLTGDDIFNLSLEELMNLNIVSVSKSKESLNDAPGIVTTITSREIEQLGALNLQEVLERATSVYTTGSFVYPQSLTTIRGDLQTVADNHVLLLVNGRPMRESMYGGMNTSIYTSFPLNTIAKVEVVRGPGSVLYGSNAYSGVINIITKTDKENYGQMTTTMGSFGTLQTNGSFGFSKNDLSVSGGVMHHNSEGWDFTATDELGLEGTSPQVQKNKGIHLNTTYKNFRVNALYSSANFRYLHTTPRWARSATPTEADTNRFFIQERFMVDLGYTLKISPSITTDINLSNSTYNQKPVWDVHTNDLLAEVNTYIKPVSFENLNVLVGSTYYRQSGAFNGESGRYSLVPWSRTQWYSGYAQADYKLFNMLKLIAGGQLNKIENLNAKFVPRLGAIFSHNDRLGAKILYGQAFRAPYFIERSANSTVLVGNPNLTPETISNLDVQVFYNTPKLQLAATYFNYRQEDLIGRKIVKRTAHYINSGTSKGNGVELEGKFVPVSNVFITGSYTYQSNYKNDTIANANHTPQHMAKLGATYRHNRGFSVGLFNSYFSRPNPVSAINPKARTENPNAEAFHYLTAKVDFDVFKLAGSTLKESLIFSVYSNNVLNQKINVPEFSRRTIMSIPGRPGRGIYGSVTFKF